MSTPPGQPISPPSPDELQGGLRGRVRGVTRIGRRAVALAFAVICGLIIAIFVGINRGSAFSAAPQAQAYNTPPPGPATGERFGANEPLVVPTIAPTAPPALVLAETPAPNLTEQQRRPAPAAAATLPARIDDAAAQQARGAVEQARAAAQEARAEADRRRRERLEEASRAPLVGSAYSGNAHAPGVPASASAADSADPSGIAPANVTLPVGGSPKDFLQAQRFAPISPYEIVASSVIPAGMITAIDSELPGPISAQVREDVYDSKTGRYLLIPKGSRLIGLYKNDVKYGESRVLVAWTRLIFPDTTSIDLQGMAGADVEGHAGVAGSVDNHYAQVFGAAILTSVLAAGVQLAQPRNTSIFTSPSAGQVVGQAAGTQIATTGSQILQKSLNVPPTLHIPKGYPFVVLVDRDIVLPGPYSSEQQ